MALFILAALVACMFDELSATISVAVALPIILRSAVLDYLSILM